MGEYLVYSLQNMKHFDIERYYFGCFFVYPQILDPGAVQTAEGTVYGVCGGEGGGDVVEMEVVVIQ